MPIRNSENDQANAAAAMIDGQRRSAEDAAYRVNEALLPLSTLLGTELDDSAATPYSADVTQGLQDSTAAVGKFRDTKERAERCRIDREAAVQDLVVYANQKRYEALATQARRSILDSAPDLLAARAAEWSAALQARLATLTSDLENANRHRKTIVDRLGALVDQAAKTLRQATKLSRLPEDLAEWGGRPFLRITFSDPDRTAIAVRVGEVVDRAAAEHTATSAVGSWPLPTQLNRPGRPDIYPQRKERR